MKKNPVYLFYEVVANGADGTPGDDGDVHYCCLHGAHKVCTIKRSMQSNLNGVCSFFFCSTFLTDRDLNRDEPLTHAEIDVASAKWQLDGNREHEFLEKLNRLSGNIKKAFQDQQARAVGPWNQEKFEKALMEWIIACDQPFDEVEKPEFIALMMITHHASGLFKIPKRDGIKQRVCLSLDMWTSSNQHAFMAIVAHYITNNGQLGLSFI
ncbi:hypothetical protein DFH94DRAFT_636686 [Russula ochroleuca]|uniref:Uncharacterized protein n=1 Tax=Russula ochroleuca TaxID=152965 RepID=A0A9P5K0I0_9AGAM|nr:hypothetical protein DFH94DRAFT_636686 [Russula ochroleuca]